MSFLTTRLSSNFAMKTRSKGSNYYYRDQVDIVDGDDYTAVAIVRGSEYYDVDLSIEDQTLQVYCSCPHFFTAYCKHIWATMLAAEAEGLLEAGRTVRRMGRLLERLDSRPNDKQREQPPAWQEQLATLGRNLKESKTRD